MTAIPAPPATWITGTATGERRFHVAVAVRWRDLDAYNHVNNATLFTLLEEARTIAFWRRDAGDPTAERPLAVVDATADSDTHTLIRSHSIEYRAPIPYAPEPIDIALWVSRLDAAACEISYEVRSADQSIVHTLARTELVFVDTATDRPRRVTPVERAAWEPFVGEPVRLRADRRH